MKPAFCAGCIKVRTDLVQRGAVWLCPDCDPESDTPTRRSGRPVFRGYSLPAEGTRIATLKAFTAAAQRIAPVQSKKPKWNGRDASPGFILVRVPRRPKGIPIDAKEARQTLAHEPWHAELRHLGSDVRFHIFERPDSELAKRIRSTSMDGRGALDVLRDAVERTKR